MISILFSQIESVGPLLREMEMYGPVRLLSDSFFKLRSLPPGMIFVYLDDRDDAPKAEQLNTLAKAGAIVCKLSDWRKK